MTGTEIVVTLLGLAAIGWVNWYFFLAGRGEAVAEVRGGGPQRVRVVVRGGYDPSVIRVQPGRPVRLEFDRRETSGCTEEVVVPDFGIRRFLPPHQTTAVDLPAPQPGRYEFTCGMSMVRGTIIAEPQDGTS